MALVAPLDLEQHFVVTAAGSSEIFTFLAMLLVSYAFGRLNLPNKIALPIFALFTVLMATYIPGLYVLIILVSGLTTFFALSKMTR